MHLAKKVKQLLTTTQLVELFLYVPPYIVSVVGVLNHGLADFNNLFVTVEF